MLLLMWMRILNIMSSGAESIEMHVPLTSKYRNRVLLVTYTAIFSVYIAT